MSEAPNTWRGVWWRKGNLVPIEHAPVRASRPTIVYVIEADHAVKVGVTSMTIEARINDLTRAAGIRPAVIATFTFKDGSDARRVERVAHWLLRDTRTHGEWFHCRASDAVDAVRKATRGSVYLDYLRWGDPAKEASTV